MPDDQESNAVEPPWWINWGRYFFQHLKQEGTVIRRAPLAVLATAAVLAVIVYLIVSAQYSERLDNMQSSNSAKDGAIENKDSEISALQEEMKSASPALAAIQARRIEKRRELQSIYVECGSLFREGFTVASLNNKASETEWINKVNIWATETTLKVQKDFGDAAAERLSEPNASPLSYTSLDPPMSNTESGLRSIHSNLSVLISTAAFDN